MQHHFHVFEILRKQFCAISFIIHIICRDSFKEVLFELPSLHSEIQRASCVFECNITQMQWSCSSKFISFVNIIVILFEKPDPSMDPSGCAHIILDTSYLDFIVSSRNLSTRHVSCDGSNCLMTFILFEVAWITWLDRHRKWFA